MTSHVTKKFRVLFYKLPERVQKLAKENYLLWKRNEKHPSLNFKKVSKNTNTYSVRIGLGYRALGIKSDKTMIWFWIGSHEDYNKLL